MLPLVFKAEKIENEPDLCMITGRGRIFLNLIDPVNFPFDVENLPLNKYTYYHNLKVMGFLERDGKSYKMTSKGFQMENYLLHLIGSDTNMHLPDEYVNIEIIAREMKFV